MLNFLLLDLEIRIALVSSNANGFDECFAGVMLRENSGSIVGNTQHVGNASVTILSWAKK